MKIAIGSDHGGVELKAFLAKELAASATVFDKGPAGRESCDYPDYAAAVAREVAAGSVDFGILICRSGIGMAMAANRFQNVRAATCATTEAATLTRQHNGANVLCLGADTVSAQYALEIAKAFMATPVDMDERHARRRWKLERAERLSDCSGLMRDDPEVFAAIEAQTRQEDAEINLIASENTSSRACREAAGSVLMNKYAEGYPGKRWYSGCLPVDAAEELARRRACVLFGADHANVQPHCGSAANMAVYFATIKPGDTIMSMSLDQGGPLENIIAAKAVVFREWMCEAKKGYAQQVVKNCAVMCKTVQDRGYRIVSGGTDNHLFLVDVKKSKGITGKEAAAALDAAGIIVNKNTIPFDTESPFKTSGIRVGTASATTRGMKEPEMIKIGTWIADVLDNIADESVQARVKAEAAKLVAGFPVP